LLVWLSFDHVILLVIRSLKVPFDVEVVRMHCICPTATEWNSLTVSTIVVVTLVVGSNGRSIGIVATAPTIILQSKEGIIFTSFSAGVLVVSILLWSEIEISVTIIVVATEVSVVRFLDVSVVGVHGIRPSSAHTESIFIRFTTVSIRS
jgi:hypothetical protein